MSFRKTNSKCQMGRALLACFAWLCLSAAVVAAEGAGISFRSSKITQRAEFGAGAVEFVFQYRNGSVEPVAVDHVEEGCGCFKANIEFEGVGVNEEGQVRGVFATKGLSGTVTKSIWVVFTNKERHELVAELIIPGALVVEPNNLVWQRGAEAAEQRVDIRVEAGPPLDLTGVLSNVPQFTVRSETLVAGKHYVLHVRPASTDAELSAVLQVRTSSTDSRDAIRTVFAFINDAGQKGGTK
jgi:hypothetical protein